MLIKKKLQITLISIASVILASVIILLIIFNIIKISYNASESSIVDSQITITRDSKGIPSIEVETVNDFYFALGYLHAKDRLNTIEYLRSVATGNSDRYAGQDTQLLKNLSNTIGFTKNAAEISEKLKEEDIVSLKSYVNGINHVRNKNRVSNLINREWIPEDILAILSLKEWANSYLNNTELIFNLSETELNSKKNLLSDSRYLYFYNDDDNRYLYTLRRIKELVEKHICTFARGNSIYIAPVDSSTGIDTYTTLNYDDSTGSYPGWFPVKLVLKGKKISAVTYNGLPFILSFKNETVSLTQVNINADTQNFYLFETENKDSGTMYKTAGSWKEFKTVRIPSYTRGEVSAEIKWVTEKGPIISDLISSTKSDTRIMVLDSIQPGAEYISLLLNMPFENDIENARKAITANDSSLKCFIVSDNKKAYKIFSGLINRPDNNNRVFLDGNKLSKSNLSKISVIRQISGCDYTGSDLISKKDLPEYVKNIISNDFKIERFNSLLLNKKLYDNDRIKNIITDNVSVAAQKFIPLFNSMLSNNPLTSSKLSRIYFSDWDCSAKPGLQAPSIFFTTLSFFISESYKDDFGKDSDFNLSSSYLLYPEFYAQCQKKSASLFDRSDTPAFESMEMIYDTAFLNSMRLLNRKEGPFMENWKWGFINRSSFKAPTEKISLFSRFFKIEDLPLSGGPDTIDNVLQNSRFSTISTTSFQSFMNNETLWFKMNAGYSTLMLSDFYYGSNKLDNFCNINTNEQIYKTVITRR